MTVKEIYSRGVYHRHVKSANSAQAAYYDMMSEMRYDDLNWMLEARRINIRSAHRRWLRRNGLPLTRKFGA